MRFSIYDEEGNIMRKLWDKEAAESYVRYKEGWYYIEAKKYRNKRTFDLSQYEPALF